MSGEKFLKILCNKFGFRMWNRRGSHCTLINESVRPPIILEIYMHNELKHGSLVGLLGNAGISREEFLKHV
jgi:predicted RNA binding protein YcfA (HicA-like mRNA interferase family)